MRRGGAWLASGAPGLVEPTDGGWEGALGEAGLLERGGAPQPERDRGGEAREQEEQAPASEGAGRTDGEGSGDEPGAQRELEGWDAPVRRPADLEEPIPAAEDVSGHGTKRLHAPRQRARRRIRPWASESSRAIGPLAATRAGGQAARACFAVRCRQAGPRWKALYRTHLLERRRPLRRRAAGGTHPRGAPAWIAVSVTVKTMSSTRHPRERSFTGFASPWSMGPMLTTLALRWTAL